MLIPLIDKIDQSAINLHMMYMRGNFVFVITKHGVVNRIHAKQKCEVFPIFKSITTCESFR